MAVTKEHRIVGQRRIFLIDAVDCVAEENVEAEYTLDREERRILAHADNIVFKLTKGTETGSPNFTIDSIAIYDGTSWFTIETFGTAITVDAAGCPGVAVKAVSGHFGYGTKLKLEATVTTLTADNHVTLTAVLEVTADRQYAGAR